MGAALVLLLVGLGAMAAGVLIGGILTSLLNWRWVLFVNVPIGIVLLAGAWVALPRSERRTRNSNRLSYLYGKVFQ